MRAFPPNTGDSASDAEVALRRGRARQRQMARVTRRDHVDTRIPSNSFRPAQLSMPRFSEALDLVRGVLGAGWQRFRGWSKGGQLTLIVVVFLGLIALFSLVSLNATGDVLPGVSVGGVRVAGLSEETAAMALREAWAERMITIRDGDRVWTRLAQELGFRLDAAASAREAIQYGRNQGLWGAFKTALGGTDLTPVIDVDLDAARDALTRLAGEVYVAPRNATVRLEGGLVTHVNAQPGRRLVISQLLPVLAASPVTVVQSGQINLPVEELPAQVIDAAPLVTYAQHLLQRPLTVEAYDPVSDKTFPFTLQPGDWGQWLDTRLVRHQTGPRLYLSAAAGPVRDYLQAAANELPEPLTLDLGDGVRAIQDAITTGELDVWVTVRYKPVEYTVSRGESAYSISRTEGIPFYLIQQANPERDLSTLYVGDTLILPSRDVMLPLRPVRNKRIIVDLSDQYMWAYENGQVRFEWPISSGMDSAPTSTGVFQILSHVDRAYGSSFTLCDADSCGQWVMHWFMGVYEAVPGLMNGFHGAVDLPNGTTLGGGNVGRPYTFGCIMALDDNAKMLYDWAEEGVVVEIRA